MKTTLGKLIFLTCIFISKLNIYGYSEYFDNSIVGATGYSTIDTNLVDEHNIKICNLHQGEPFTIIDEKDNI